MNVRSTSNVNSSDLIQRHVAVSIPEYTPERDNLRNTTRVCFKTKKLLARMCVCVHMHMLYIQNVCLCICVCPRACVRCCACRIHIYAEPRD